jgi:hypothetical protein
MPVTLRALRRASANATLVWAMHENMVSQANMRVLQTTVVTDPNRADMQPEPLTEVKIRPSASGGWIYEVWIQNRPVVIGWCKTREKAEGEAALV